MKTVVVYSASWCAPCKGLKLALAEAKITYDTVDVDVDMDATKSAGVRGVPTTIVLDENGIKDSTIVGFNKDTIPKILEALK